MTSRHNKRHVDERNAQDRRRSYGIQVDNVHVDIRDVARKDDVKPHIWLVSEQFLVSYVDLFGVLPDFQDQTFICYRSPPKRGSRQVNQTKQNQTGEYTMQITGRNFIDARISRLSLAMLCIRD